MIKNKFKIIYLDMDDTICSFVESLCSQCNEQLNLNIKPSDIKSWELEQYIGKEGIEIFNKPGFFLSLKPIDGAIETINKLLDEGYEIFIISSPQNEHSCKEKYIWVKEFLPKFNIGNLILVGNKGELLKKLDRGILFDDCPKYIRDFGMSGGTTVVMDRPYNQCVESSYRIYGNDWDKFYEVVKSLSCGDAFDLVNIGLGEYR